MEQQYNCNTNIYSGLNLSAYIYYIHLTAILLGTPVQLLGNTNC